MSAYNNRSTAAAAWFQQLIFPCKPSIQLQLLHPEWSYATDHLASASQAMLICYLNDMELCSFFILDRNPVSISINEYIQPKLIGILCFFRQQWGKNSLEDVQPHHFAYVMLVSQKKLIFLLQFILQYLFLIVKDMYTHKLFFIANKPYGLV